MSWDLSRLLADLHDRIENDLRSSRQLGHPVAKGSSSETVWLDMLNIYLPKRYSCASAFVVDSDGDFSDQIDIVIFDRQYSPFILEHKGQTVVPAESVYAVFESKQEATADNVVAAQEKALSVRRLNRTSVPIPNAGPKIPAKEPPHIIGGLLTFESVWKPPMGEPLTRALEKAERESRLDIGCVAAAGHFVWDEATGYSIVTDGRPATAFLFELIARLQKSGTVAMIDIRAYARWLA